MGDYMSSQLISLNGVRFKYPGGSEVFKSLNFDLNDGERVALLGANGSGKTTLLHIIVGLLRPAAGQIKAFGKDCRNEQDFYEVRSKAGLLFQDADDQLFCPTVGEEVAFGPLNLGKSREETWKIVRETLVGLGLKDYENRITYQLSGGEKRLVSFASVLALQPEVLLLDEPTSGLDDEHIEQIISILSDFSRTTIVVSHDRDFLHAVTNKTRLLKDGKVEDLNAGLRL
jgi:cobalt/nickel transport system ATP-binding protein